MLAQPGPTPCFPQREVLSDVNVFRYLLDSQPPCWWPRVDLLMNEVHYNLDAFGPPPGDEGIKFVGCFLLPTEVEQLDEPTPSIPPHVLPGPQRMDPEWMWMDSSSGFLAFLCGLGVTVRCYNCILHVHLRSQILALPRHVLFGPERVIPDAWSSADGGGGCENSVFFEVKFLWDRSCSN